MAIEKSLRNLVLLVLAVIIVILLWRAIWFLAGLVVFVVIVYLVYEFLKGEL